MAPNTDNPFALIGIDSDSLTQKPQWVTPGLSRVLRNRTLDDFPGLRIHVDWANYYVQDFLHGDRDEVFRYVFDPRSVALRFELGAVLRIASWQGIGIDPVTRLGLPSLEAATAYYVTRQFTDSHLPDTLRRTYPLFVRVMAVALTKFVPIGDDNPFGPYLMVEEPPEDAFAELVARYLWTMRGRSTGGKADESQQES